MEDPREIRFRRLCTALRLKDPAVTKVHFRPALTNGGAHILGEAVKGNPFVASIELNLSELSAHDPDTLMRCLAPLLRYICTAPALRSVGLDAWNTENRHTVAPAAVRLFLVAIRDNPGIKCLHLIKIKVGTREAVMALVETARTLHRLTIRGCEFNYDATTIGTTGSATASLSSSSAAAAGELLATAIGANRALETLSIQTKYGGGALEERILLQLGSQQQQQHSGRLKELVLDSQFNDVSQKHVTALAYLLRSSTTLEHLSLWFYAFPNKDLLEPLVKGIRSSGSLRRLSLKKCRFDLESTQLFTKMLTFNAFRELHLSDLNFFAHPTGIQSAPTLAPLQVRGEETGSGMETSSCLEILDMATVRDRGTLISICDELGANASRIHLKRFHYGYMDVDGNEALAKCLPKLIHLKELEIALVAEQVDSRKLLRALYRNGSVEHVAIRTGPDLDRTQPFFSGSQLRRLQLYCCHRNKTIPILAANAEAHLNSNNNITGTDLGIFPKLFRVAKQAPRMAATNILLGLLAAGDSIGPNAKNADEPIA